MGMYVVMSFLMGFTGNKLFNKNNASTENSIKWGAIITIILLITYYIIKKTK